MVGRLQRQALIDLLDDADVAVAAAGPQEDAADVRRFHDVAEKAKQAMPRPRP